MKVINPLRRQGGEVVVPVFGIGEGAGAEEDARFADLDADIFHLNSRIALHIDMDDLAWAEVEVQ